MNKNTAQQKTDTYDPMNEIDRLRSELLIEREKLLSTEKLLEQERKKHAEIRKLEAIRIKTHLNYRLGEVLVEYGGNPLKWYLLAWKLYAAHKAFQKEREGNPLTAKGNFSKKDILSWLKLLETKDNHALLNYIAPATAHQRTRKALKAINALANSGEYEAAYQLSEALLSVEYTESTLRNCMWQAQKTKRLERAAGLILEIEAHLGENPSQEEAERLFKLKSSVVFQLSVLTKIQPRKEMALIETIPDRVCYVLHNSLPYCSGGYATRAQGVALGMIREGLDVVCVTRPGFPLDIDSGVFEADVPESQEIKGITYHHITHQKRSNPISDYLLACADIMESQLRLHRPSMVLAASNYITALPALIAARRLGLPFFYEVRGLWEVTRMSKEPEFQKTAAFATQRTFETIVAREADHVFTLTEALREELITRGVNANGHIDLFPNCCDPNRFLPRPRDEELAAKLGIPENVPVIGYIGTFVSYEGLDDLAAACGILKRRGIKFRLLIVGSENAAGNGPGPIAEQITEQVMKDGFSDWLIMPGRVPHSEVEKYYSLIDIAPFPRKPWPVCEMVSPIKPLEALAMEKAVVVSSVRALTEMVDDNRSGLVFEKGNPKSLATALDRLIKDPDLRKELGKAGRAWVQAERDWKKACRKLAKHLKNSQKQKTA